MILVAGATTNVGKMLVAKLLGRRLPVRVMVRRADDARRFAELGAHVARADLRDEAAVRGAAVGAATVVSLIGRHFAQTEAELWQTEVEGTKVLIRAAQAARADRFVMLSVLWSDQEPGPVLFRAKRQAEDALLASGLSHTILRPSMFATGPNSLFGGFGPTLRRFGTALIPAPDSKPISVLTLDDLSDALLAVTLDHRHAGGIYDLGGPEAVTLAQALPRIGKALGKEPRVIRVPRTVLRWLRRAARLRGFAAYEILLFVEMLADLGFACDERRNHLSLLLGRAPQAFDVEIRKQAASATDRAPATRDQPNSG